MTIDVFPSFGVGVAQLVRRNAYLTCTLLALYAPGVPVALEEVVTSKRGPAGLTLLRNRAGVEVEPWHTCHIAISFVLGIDPSNQISLHKGAPVGQLRCRGKLRPWILSQWMEEDVVDEPTDLCNTKLGER